MLHYPDIDPVAFALGPIKVYWYGLMYLVGISTGWWLGRHRAKQWGWSKAQVDDLVFYIVLGVLCGGRLGYVLFYGFAAYVADPLALFRVWSGGMSFHGGLLGVLVAVGWFSYRRNRKFFEVTDFLAPLCPIGLGAGRLGNFINGELWGKPTEVPWGMVFPFAEAGAIARHPSQLYQAFFEGLVLFVILWSFSRRPRPTMMISGLFLVSYGVFRFLVEFVREPDRHIGYLALDWLTLGQVLTVPMMLLGVVLIFLALRQNRLFTPHSTG